MHWSIVINFSGWLALMVVHLHLHLVGEATAMKSMLVLLFFYLFFSFRRFPNLGFVLVLSSVIQLLIAPSVSLRLGMPFALAMGYDEVEYFKLVFPAIYALALGVFWPVSTRKFDAVSFKNQIEAIPVNILIKWLFVVGSIMMTMPILGRIPIAGAILDYSWKAIYMIAMLFYLRKEWEWLLVAVGLLLARALAASFFFEPGMFLLMALIVMIYARWIWRSTALLVCLIGMVSIPVVQSAKSTFRMEAFGNNEVTYANRISMFVEALDWSEVGGREAVFETDVLLRLNQGFYDSHVYRRDLFQDNTIVPSFFSVVIPRFLWPDKPSFNNQKLKDLGNYRNMGSSFISISQVCESLNSWGRNGGVVFLWVYGFSLMMLVRRLALRADITTLLMPVLFIHVVRAEADFTHVASSLIHGGIAIWLTAKILGHICHQSTFND
jgi:hypothetical protein